MPMPGVLPNGASYIDGGADTAAAMHCEHQGRFLKMMISFQASANRASVLPYAAAFCLMSQLALPLYTRRGLGNECRHRRAGEKAR
jgi:hypothetical protein